MERSAGSTDGYGYFHWSLTPFPDWRLKSGQPANEYSHWLRSKGIRFEYSPFQGSKYVEVGIEAEEQSNHLVRRESDQLHRGQCSV